MFNLYEKILLPISISWKVIAFSNVCIPYLPISSLHAMKFIISLISFCITKEAIGYYLSCVDKWFMRHAVLPCKPALTKRSARFNVHVGPTYN